MKDMTHCDAPRYFIECRRSCCPCISHQRNERTHRSKTFLNIFGAMVDARFARPQSSRGITRVLASRRKPSIRTKEPTSLVPAASKRPSRAGLSNFCS